MIDCSQLTIRNAAVSDLRYVIDQQKRWSNQVGFIRKSNLEQLVERGTIYIPEINGQTCGVVICSGGIRCAACLRTNIVERELWENGLGKQFCEWLRTQVPARTWGGYRVITRRDLQRQASINRSLGGVISTTREGGARGVAVDEWWVPTITPAEGLPQRTYYGSPRALRRLYKRSSGIGS